MMGWALVLGWAAAAEGSPSAAALKADWAAQDHAAWVHRPSFSDKEWARLAEGKGIKRREKMEGADRVLGALWSPAPKDALWVGIQDENHWVVVDGYVDEDLPGSTFQNRTLYQRIGLPWPFADRQWVIDVRSNRALVTASDGHAWERTWTISPQRGASVEDPDAVWVEENEGAWVLVDLAEGTLAIYYVRATVDGNIPDEAATRWALMTVSGLLEDVDKRARTQIPSHYVEGHRLIERPDGSTIPLYTSPAP